MNLDWSAQHHSITKRINYYCHLIIKHKLTLKKAKEFWNLFLIPKIDISLRYCHPTKSELIEWDRILIKTIEKLLKIARPINRFAISCLTGFILPSQHMYKVKISETFIRLNSKSNNSTLAARKKFLVACEWFKCKKQQIVTSSSVTPITFDYTKISNQKNNRFGSILSMCYNIGWEMKFHKPNPPWIQPIGVNDNDSTDNYKFKQIHPTASTSTTITFDHYKKLENFEPKQSIHVYTDGS